MIHCNLSNTDNPLLQIKECLGIIKEIDCRTCAKKKIILDLSDMKWILPCSALLLSSKINEMALNEIKVEYNEPTNPNVKSYLNNIGFPLGDRKKAKSYSPIYHFTNNTNEAINTVLEVVKNTFSTKVSGALMYILSELGDNIDQHAKHSHASIMAQQFGKKGHIDIGVFDNGISIPKCYEDNSIKFIEDAEAINKALSGISTKKEDGRGRGLCSSQRLVEQGLKGNFYIISRRGALSTGHGYERKIYKLSNYNLSGTLVYMRFASPERKLNIFEHIN